MTLARLSLGNGFAQLMDCVFPIGQLCDFNGLSLARAPSGRNLRLKLTSVPHQAGGVDAAMAVLAFDFRLGLRVAGGDRLFDILQHERELVRIDLFRSRAKAMTLKLLDVGDEALVLVARGDEQFLERSCIVGKRIRRRRHSLTESFPIVGVTSKI